MTKKITILKISCEQSKWLDEFLSNSFKENNINYIIVDLKEVENQKFEEVDIIHLPDISLLKKIPFPIKARIVLDIDRISWGKFSKLKYIKNIKFVDHIIVGNNELKKIVNAELKVPLEKISSRYASKNMNLYSSKKIHYQRIATLAQKMNNQLDKNTILVVGDVEGIEKNKYSLNKLLSKNVFVAILCKKTKESALICDSFRNHDNASILFECNDLPALYVLSDMAILSYSNSNEAIEKIFDLQAMEKPVVHLSSLCEDIPFLVEGDKEMNFIDDFLKIKKNEILEIRSNIRNSALEFASPEKYSKKTLSIYKTLDIV